MSAAGFIGIGNMGWPMARRLSEAGFDLQVFDTDPQRVSAFCEQFRATPAQSPAELSACEIVVTMLPDGHIVRTAIVDSGLAQALRPGSLIVDMSSSAPQGTRVLGGELAALGLVLVDAPVSGLVPRAEAGSLTIMIGTDDPHAVARLRPLLSVLGESLIPVGSLGCGHAMKALNNVVAAAAFAVTAEALIVGQRFGLDPATMVEVIDRSSGRNFHTATSFPNEVLTRRFETGFALGLLAKDTGIAAELAAGIGTDTPLIAQVAERWAQARDAIGPLADNARAIEHWEQANGVEIKSG